MKNLARLGAALLVVAASTACAGGAGGADDQTFKVGLLLPSTGPFAGLAEDQADGFRHYVENVAKNQFGESDVEIVTADEGNDPTIARESAQRLVEREEVDAIVGVINSAVAYAIAPYLNESGVPTILTGATADDLTQRQDAPNVFRVVNAASQLMLPLGDYVCKELGYQKAAIVSLDYAFGWEAMGGFAKSYEDAGCEVEQEIYTPLGTQDWGSVVQQIDDDVDVIVQTTSGSDAGKLLRAYKDYGLTNIPMIANGWGTDPSTLPDQSQRQLAVPITSVHYYAEASDNPANVEFTSSFRDEYGHTPGAYSEATYVAAMVLDQAVQAAGSLDAESLTEAIGDVTLDDAPRGTLEFDEYGQAVVPLYLRKMVEVNGELENQIEATIVEDSGQFWEYDADEAMAEEPFNDRKGTWAN